MKCNGDQNIFDILLSNSQACWFTNLLREKTFWVLSLFRAPLLLTPSENSVNVDLVTDFSSKHYVATLCVTP